jgi:hypothetical protein
MDVARLARSLPIGQVPSPLDGAEHVRGFGVPALCFDSGHVLGLRAFTQSDFGPYRSIWHRDAAGAWKIHVDGVAVDKGCPRYFGRALESSQPARIALDWRGPSTLAVTMDAPALEWIIELRASPVLLAMNALLSRLSDRAWSQPSVPRLFEHVARFFLGDADMLGEAPNGQAHLMAPQRMFLIAASRAVLSGQDLGRPIRARPNPRIGSWRLPARGILAMGRGFFRAQQRQPAAGPSCATPPG